MPPFNRSAAEKKAETLFRQYKAALIKRFGRGPLSTDDIDAFGAETFGPDWGGSGDQNITLKPGKLYVINSSRAPKSPGVHWTGVAVSKGGIVYMYDSFARNATHLMPTLAKNIRKGGGIGKHYTQSDPTDKEQVGDSAVCGHLSLSWLCVVHTLGIRAAMLI